MTVIERVDSDLKEAMRAKDTTKRGVLRMLKSALKYAAIAKSGAETELSDADAAQVIRKQTKQRQDSIESFEKGGRADLADKEKEELSILNGYLPQGMSAGEVAGIVRETIVEVGATSKAQMGAVMKALQVKVAGREDRHDGIKAIVREEKFEMVWSIIPGGKHRQDSVQAGMNHLDSGTRWIAVHDAARPLITPEQIERVFQQCTRRGAAALAEPIK